jgi:hypothetical protein
MSPIFLNFNCSTFIENEKVCTYQHTVLGIPSEAVAGHHRMHLAHEAEVPSYFVIENRHKHKTWKSEYFVCTVQSACPQNFTNKSVQAMLASFEPTLFFLDYGKEIFIEVLQTGVIYSYHFH